MRRKSGTTRNRECNGGNEVNEVNKDTQNNFEQKIE